LVEEPRQLRLSDRKPTPVSATPERGSRTSRAEHGSSIWVCCHHNMIRTQISVDEEIYARAKAVARRHGISLAELCRRGLEELVAREPSSKPWMAFAGVFEGDEADSSSVDRVVYDREQP